MLQCYMCGSKIREGEGQRRHIVTGTRSAQVRGGDRFDMRDQSEISVAGARTELRMLCAGCAADHDARQRRNTLVALAVFAVVAVLFAAGAFFAWNHFQEEKRKADQDFERDRQQMHDDFERRQKGMDQDFERRRREMDSR